MAGYDADLAFVHDVGFGTFSEKAGPGLIALLEKRGIDRGLVVDLGCGSGIWAAEASRAGYDVLGIDQSEAMIALARKRAPRRAGFRVARGCGSSPAGRRGTKEPCWKASSRRGRRRRRAARCRGRRAWRRCR